MSKESVSRLSELTGFDRRTVTKRLEDVTPLRDGRAYLYETRDVLPILYGFSTKDGNYDLTEERARLAHHQANLAALDEEVKKKSLIPAEVVTSTWQEEHANVRARLLSIPSQLAAACANASREVVEEHATELVKQALEELSDAPAY